MQKETGNLSIDSHRILPIIKKWLYSDQDIFLREMVSNACDAITKYKKIAQMEGLSLSEDEKFYVRITVDEKKKQLCIEDNGIGMTKEEINKYINQIAFSGAEDFIRRYEEKIGNDHQIIGHFGLGFYSAFMVSDWVSIHTQSYQKDAPSAYWKSDGGIEYEMSTGDNIDRGTMITLQIAKDAKEFLQIAKIKEILQKYCAFMPYPIYVKEADKEEEWVNQLPALWLEQPSKVTKDEYENFYREVFHDFQEPLFWIHLNMDYPMPLRGILYFPRFKNNFDMLEGEVKLYNNRVFVADNIKEVIPEFLLLLKGVIDCPDMPLNVSRSFLQHDGYVERLSTYISKKVADKLKELYKKEKERYENIWNDLSVFIKFGCLKEEKFYDKVKSIILLKDIHNQYESLNDVLKKDQKTLYYVSDETKQHAYIEMFKAENLQAYELSSPIDPAFISLLEMKENLKFLRIDAELSQDLFEEDETDEALEHLFKEIVHDDLVKIEVKRLKNSSSAAILFLSEQSRRMLEMMKIYQNSMPSMPFQKELTLVLNANHPIIQQLQQDTKHKELIASYIYDLAKLSHETLEKEEMSRFIERSYEILTYLKI